MRRIVRVSTRTRNGVFAGSFAAPPPAMARNAARTISRSAARVPFIRDLYAATAAKVPQPRLFDRDGLREVPRLVDVQAAEARDRPVLHLAGRVGVGRDVRDLLQLQRPLEAHRQADVPAEVEEELLVVHAPRDLLDRVVAVEEGLDLLRER